MLVTQDVHTVKLEDIFKQVGPSALLTHLAPVKPALTALKPLQLPVAKGTHPFRTLSLCTFRIWRALQW